MKLNKIGVYVRVSTQEQSTELQLGEIQTYLTSRGWHEVSIYEDKATGTNNNRAELKRLLNDARQRKLDTVVVWKLDRFARSLKDLVVMLQELSELGVDFISLRDNLDLTTSAGRLMFHIVGSFAEFEAALIRERVRAGIANAKAKGKRLGRAPQIDSARVLSLRHAGLSLSQIAKVVGATKSGVSKTLSKQSGQVAVSADIKTSGTGVDDTDVSETAPTESPVNAKRLIVKRG